MVLQEDMSGFIGLRGLDGGALVTIMIRLETINTTVDTRNPA